MTQAALEKTRIRRSFAAAAMGYDAVADLQRQIGLEMLRRFPPKSDGDVAVDLGSGTGFLSEQMSRSAGVDSLVAIDLALPMLEVSRRKHASRAIHHVCADAERLPLRSGYVTQIYSNLALQWLQDLSSLFSELRRVLQPQGQLVFTTFGPQTLKELKSAWAAVDDAVHVNSFVAEEGITRALQAAGFASLSIESEIHVCRYASVLELMRELKGLGAHNVNAGRKHKLTTKAELSQMMLNYQQAMASELVEASYEIIYVRASA